MWRTMGRLAAVMLGIVAGGGGVVAGDEQPGRAVEQDRTAVLDRVLKGIDEAAEPQAQRDTLRRAIADSLPQLAGNLDVTRQLQTALAEDEKIADPSDGRDRLRRAVDESRDLLAFEPWIQAPLPVGFPAPAPAGEIRVKDYPQYRLARTAMGVEFVAFWTLFNHIQKNKVEMTAPVEMTFEGKERKDQPTAMAFLYQNVDLGKAGQQGAVAVEDVPAMTTVSIGVRGRRTRERVAEARARLETWLNEHADEYAASGPLRVMGYNDPSVPERRQYFEVEFPVVRRLAAK